MENKITPKQALENLYELASPYKKPDLYSANNNYQIIDQALTELEETKQINEIFKNAITIKNTDIRLEEKLDHSKDTFIYSIKPIVKIIQNNIEEELKRQLREWVLKNAFPKELQILEVLKNKKPNLFILYYAKRLSSYNDTMKERQLTETEFNLLKEWLCEKKN